ncbi:TrbC/VirB2 family protein [Ralstonia pseudosolanacearum]|uniref:TrbC/VirB2 family protein n=1 Tax=Ralstonia pseudosolanacearum TaxID=1310165 RepID=UPI003AABB3B6
MKTPPKNHVVMAALFASLLCCAPAFAGGLDSGTQAGNTFKIWFYGFCGICAGIYLLWVGLELWSDKARWADFGMAVGKVAAVGAVVVIAPWAWNLFVS